MAARLDVAVVLDMPVQAAAQADDAAEAVRIAEASSVLTAAASA